MTASSYLAFLPKDDCSRIPHQVRRIDRLIRAYCTECNLFQIKYRPRWTFITVRNPQRAFALEIHFPS